MGYLALSIAASTTIYVVFKLVAKYRLNMAVVISINYLTASIVGFSLMPVQASLQTIAQAPWFPIAALIGVLFVAMFYLIGKSTQLAGVSITALATRMSMVIPIAASIALFGETFNGAKAFKLLFALGALALAIYSKPEKQKSLGALLLPFVLFFGSGATDTLVKAAQARYVPDEQLALFSTVLFGTSFLASLFFLALNFRTIKKPIAITKTLGTGLILGIANFGTLFGFVSALNHSKLESSSVFGINNIAIVSLSILIGSLVFKEKISRLNQIGAVLCIAAIAFLTIW